MKKNTMMRIASVLLIAVLLTTSVISGTYAKYVTSDSVSDSARVARFGVVVSAEGKLFGKNYLAASEDTPAGKGKDGPDGMGLTVESEEKVVAPGTKSDEEGLTLSVTGTPEVDVLVSISIDELSLLDVFLASGTYPNMTTSKDKDFSFTDDYYPIVYTLTGDLIEAKKAAIKQENIDDLKFDGDNTVYGNLQAIVDALECLFYGEDGSGIYVDAGTDLSSVDEGGIGELPLTWEWKFANENTDEDKITARDKKDTLLGDLAAFDELDSDLILESKYDELGALTEGMDEDHNLSTSIKITVTVTQVD